MKKYLKEMIILLIQLLMFYVMPLTAGPADTMGLVVLIILSVFVLSTVIACISKEKIKYFYPVVISILFIPAVFIYFNESALVYTIWFLVISSVGMGVGTIINMLIKKLRVS